MSVKNIFLVLLVSLLTVGFSGCKEDSASQNKHNEEVVMLGSDNKSAKVQIKFDQNIDKGSVSKQSVVLKDDKGKVVDKSKYALDTLDNSIVISIIDTEFKKANTKFQVDVKGVKDVFNKSVKETVKTFEVVVEDASTLPPAISSVNSGLDFKIQSSQGLRILFTKKIKSDFEIKLTKADGSVVPKQNYKTELDSQGLVLKITFENKQFATSENLNLIFDKLTDEKNNSILNKVFKFTLLINNDLIREDINLQTNEDQNNEKFIKSDQPIIITFNNSIRADSIQGNLVLKNAANTQLEADKDYKVEIIATNKAQLKITLLNQQLQQTTANYKIVIGALSDEAGNKFKNREENSETIDFKFVKPSTLSLVSDSLELNSLDKSKQIRSDKTIVLTFSAAVKKSLITKNNIVLIDATSGEKVANSYNLEYDDKARSTIKIVLTDSNFKNYDKKFKLEFVGLTDEYGNQLVSTPAIDFTYLDSSKFLFLENEKLKTGSVKADETIELKFNKPVPAKFLTNSSIKLLLKGASGNYAEIQGKYKLEQDANYKNTLKLTLTDAGLKNQTNEYRLEFNNLTDKYGNQLANATNVIDFKLIGVAGLSLTTNLTNGKLKTDQNLILTFDEEILVASINKNNFILRKKGVMTGNDLENSYTLEYNASASGVATKEVFLKLSDPNLQTKTQDYTLFLDSGLESTSGKKIGVNFQQIDVKFLDPTPMELKSSNIIAEMLNSSATQKQLILTFNKSIAGAASQDWVSIQKGTASLNASDFTIISDKKTLIISFVNFSNTEKYKISIVDNKIFDTEGNVLSVKPDPLEFTGAVDTSKILYVTTSGNATNAGDSWDSATTLSKASQTATNAGKNTIFVASGDYEISTDISFNEGIKVYGGFTGSDFQREKTNISSLLFKNAPRKISFKDSSLNLTKSDSVFDGFSVKSENISSDTIKGDRTEITDFSGAEITSGFITTNISMSISNIKLSDISGKHAVLVINTAGTQAKEVLLDNLVVTNNEKYPVVIKKGKVEIKDSLFKNNKDSGIILHSKSKDSKITINNTTFEANEDGAIRLAGKQNTVDIKNSRFVNNKFKTIGSASANGSGGISNEMSDDSKLFIENSIFKSNAGENGGAIFANPAGSQKTKSFIKNSLFVKNQSSFSGGGVYSSNTSDLVVINSVFYKNKSTSTSGAAAAIDLRNGESLISNSTFIGNVSAQPGTGGAIMLSACKLTIYNSIFKDNKAGNDDLDITTPPGCVNSNLDDVVKNSILKSVATLMGSISDLATKLGSNSMADPKITITENSTATDVASIIKANFKIQSDSPAKDAGDNSSYITALQKYNTSTSAIPIDEKDIAGKTRVVNNKIDIGAIEIQQ